ncbi:MAG: molybdenum cofactor guanylyltransferase [Pyrinomonadaceae bacterium]
MSIEAYILVGGKSSRFGSDKTLAKIEGQTLPGRAHTTMCDAFGAERVFFVAGDPESFASEAVRLNALFVYDVIQDRGPVGGLYTALTHASTDWIFLFACDLPDVTWLYVSMLKDKISEHYGVVVPEQDDGRLQPLCAFYNVAKARPVVRELTQRDGKPPAMMAVIDGLDASIAKAAEFITTPPVVWTNVNHPTDIDK